MGLGATAHLTYEAAGGYGHAVRGRAAVTDRSNMPEETKPEATGTDAGKDGAKNRDEVALELMKFIAVTTGYGKGNSTATGFSGGKAARSAEEYADSLIQ